MEIAFDSRTRNPCYVLERLPPQHERLASLASASQSQSQSTSSSRKGIHFREEKTLPAHHRSRNSYYKHSGWDRGHLIPASDFAGDRKGLSETFNLCNISPQDPTFNRKIFGRLEAFVRNLAKEEYDGSASNDDGDSDGGGRARITYVVTGPCWLPSGQSTASAAKKPMYQFSHWAIGQPPSLIHVPTHFFKVVTVVEEDEDDMETPRVLKLAAFVLPNQNLPEHVESITLQHYLVRLSDLEAVTGMTFFTKYLGPAVDLMEKKNESNDYNIRDLADALTEEVWERSANNSAVAISGASAKPSAASARRRRRLLQSAQASNEPFQHLCDSGRCSVAIKATRRRK